LNDEARTQTVVGPTEVSHDVICDGLALRLAIDN